MNSFLFDGVPDPFMVEVKIVIDSVQMADGTAVGKIGIVPIVRNEISFHPPYKERECAKCHSRDNINETILPMPQLCNECHEDFGKKYKVLHGPVASGDCTQCHNPHQSELDNLLTWAGQNICLHCHGMEKIFMDEDHKEINNTSCIECHDPHGGDDINLLLVKQ